MFNICVKPTIAVAALSFFVIAGSATLANASPDLNCDAYAQAAVDQQARNMQLKCGFGGKAWTTNYNGHKNWCRMDHVTISMVSVEDSKRKNALDQCAKKKIKFIPLKIKNCDKYAQTAVDQQVINVSAKCGFGGKAWSTNYNGHKNWCAASGVTVKMVNGETNARRSALTSCIFKK